MIDKSLDGKLLKEVLMIDELSIVETDKVNHTMEIDMLKLVVEVECFGKCVDEFDKGPVTWVRLESQSKISLSLALQPKEVETLNPSDCLQQSFGPSIHMAVNSMTVTLDGSFVKLELLRMLGKNPNFSF
ncbi:hypothetical protein Tco_1073960 [Tanacetum coccineum]